MDWQTQSYGPKGQDNLAQGSPWVKFPNRIGLKGPLPYGEVGPEPNHAHFPPLEPLQG